MHEGSSRLFSAREGPSTRLTLHGKTPEKNKNPEGRLPASSDDLVSGKGTNDGSAHEV